MRIHHITKFIESKFLFSGKRRSYFIRKVYETDLLTCPQCQGEMCIISFIDQVDVIKKILQHLGLWEESHAPPERDHRRKPGLTRAQLVIAARNHLFARCNLNTL